MKIRDTEQAEHVRHGIVWLHDAPGVIGALIHQHAVAHRHNTSITHGGHFNVVDLLAGMNRGAKMLTPVFDPLDWLAKSQRHQGYDHFFGIGARLHAKPPPTSGATTRIRCAGQPSASASAPCTKCGNCVALQIVRRPSRLCGSQTNPRHSSGTRCSGAHENVRAPRHQPPG